LTPAPSPPGPGRLETLKAEGHIFKMLRRLQINPGSPGYLSYFPIKKAPDAKIFILLFYFIKLLPAILPQMIMTLD